MRIIFQPSDLETVYYFLLLGDIDFMKSASQQPKTCDFVRISDFVFNAQ